MLLTCDRAMGGNVCELSDCCSTQCNAVWCRYVCRTARQAAGLLMQVAAPTLVLLGAVFSLPQLTLFWCLVFQEVLH